VCSFVYGQKKSVIYLFPGQGSDKRLFDSLELSSSYTIQHIDYFTPEKRTSLKEYAVELSKQIDTTESYILIGVSLGGMICSELSELLNPARVIIISSAKNRSELPFRYKFQKVIPIYTIFPSRVLKGGARLLQPIVEPDRKKNKDTLKIMLKEKDPKYMKRTIEMIIKWERLESTKTIIHIHGDADHTLPIRKVKCDYVVQKGSHMMTLTRPKKISELINSVL
jgi:esterase/lipase